MTVHCKFCNKQVDADGACRSSDEAAMMCDVNAIAIIHAPQIELATKEVNEDFSPSSYAPSGDFGSLPDNPEIPAAPVHNHTVVGLPFDSTNVHPLIAQAEAKTRRIAPPTPQTPSPTLDLTPALRELMQEAGKMVEFSESEVWLLWNKMEEIKDEYEVVLAPTLRKKK